MVYRVVPRFTIYGIIWAVLAFFLLVSNNAINHISYSLAVAIIFVGVASGVILHYKMTKRILRIIEKAGVWSTPASAWLFLIAVIAISTVFFAFITWSAIPFPSQYFMLFADFSYPLIPTSLITEALIFRSWERRNNRTIYYPLGTSIRNPNCQ